MMSEAIWAAMDHIPAPHSREEMENFRKRLQNSPNPLLWKLSPVGRAARSLSVHTTLDSSGEHNAIESNIPASASTFDSDSISSADWTEEGLVNCSENFSPIRRISATAPAEEVLATIKDHEASGLPLIIEGWHKHLGWNSELFTMNSFVGDGEQMVDARNVYTKEDVKMPLRELVRHYQTISKTAEPGEKQRFYGKDVQCPASWNEWLKSGGLPPFIHPFGADDMFSHLPVEDRPETLMCYLGIGDTFTPAHKDLCGSFGHNLMCHTEDGGSAFWFMTATGPLHQDDPATYFQETLESELDLESHTTTIAELKNAPFNVYIAEQRLGDLVLVPPRSCHQVVNHGGVTIKMSWSRMGLKSFELSLYDELPLYHRVCRQEIYRVKLNIFHAVEAYSQRLSGLHAHVSPPASSATEQYPLSSYRDEALKDQTVNETSSALLLTETTSVLKSLLSLLDDVLIQEWDSKHFVMAHLEGLELHSCDFCGADIFQSFFRCKECADGEDAMEFICCTACYVEGRSCTCESHMEPCQVRPFDDLLTARNKAAKALNLQVPLCNDRTMEGSPRLRLFEAACKLRRHKIDRTDDNPDKNQRRCTTRSETDPAHNMLAAHGLNCGGCHASLCFRHILDLHDVHAADAILAHALDEDQTAWHKLHTGTAKRRAQRLSEQERPGGPPDYGERMTWAASKFRRCRPVDGVRAKEGFYDDFMLVPPIEQAGESQDADKTSSPISVSNASTEDQVTAPTANTLFDGMLSELSDYDVDMDNSSYLGSSRASSPSPAPIRMRRAKPTKSARTTSPILVDERRASITNSASRPRPIRPSGRKPFVLVPSTPKKRRVAHDSAPSTTPTKKAKTVDLSRTPAADTSSPSSFRTPDVMGRISAKLARVLPTLVPLPSPTDPNVSRNVDPPNSSQKRAVIRSSRAQAPSNAKRDKLPERARVGLPPQRKTHRNISPIPRSSLNRPSPVIAARSTPKKPSMPSAPPIPTPYNPRIKPLKESENAHEGCAREIKVLRSRLDEALAEKTMLRLQMDVMKKESSYHKMVESRSQIEKLNKDLGDTQRQLEENAWEAERKVASLTDEVGYWKRTAARRDEDIKALELQVDRGRAAIVERDRSMSGFATIAGMVGQSIGTMLQNANLHNSSHQSNQQSPPEPPRAVPHSESSNMQVVRPASVRGFAHSGSQVGGGRHRGGYVWNNRGRASAYHHRFHGNTYSSKYRQQSETIREDGALSRGRPTHSGPFRRPTTPSPNRNIIYEREAYDEARTSTGDNRPESRSYYWDEQEDSLLSPSIQPGRRDSDRDWNSTHSRSRSPGYNTRGRSISRSRSPVTPPRTPYSPSPSSRRLDHGEDREHNLDPRRGARAPRGLLFEAAPTEDQEHSVQHDHVPQDEESRSESLVVQETVDDSCGPERSTWENAENPWTDG